MKKKYLLLSVAILLLLTGCNNQFAKQEYDSVEKIAEIKDRYAVESFVKNSMEGGWAPVISELDGRITLWEDNFEESQNVEISFLYQVTKGHGKVVHIDAENNVTTLIEGTSEDLEEIYVTKTVQMTSGTNRIKIVGYDCHMALEILSDIFE